MGNIQKQLTRLSLLFSILLFNSCVTTYLPATSIKNADIKSYKYIYITPTNSLTSSQGATNFYGQYYSTSKTINPSDEITGLLSKEGFIRLPELKSELANETLIVNFGKSGTRDTGMGGYTIEVTIQFISANTNKLVCSCTAEGQGSTEADDIRIATTRCLNKLLYDNIQ
jgi:hypothetical protein